MLIDNTRLIFGPERGYTTSIFRYFQHSEGNYYVGRRKEFFTKDNIRLTNINNDIYLNGYDPKDIYVDCSLTYFATYIRNSTNISFTNDILIYNLRDLNSFVKSLYVTLFYDFLFRIDFNYNTIMKSLLKMYDITSFLVRLIVEKKYYNQVYFINNENFNIYDILDHFHLEHPIYNKPDFPTENTNIHLLESLQEKIINDETTNQELSHLYKKHFHILTKMKIYIDKYQEEINELNEKNIRALKTCNFILGDFDEEKFRKEFNNNKITDDYVKNKIISNLPKGIKYE